MTAEYNAAIAQALIESRNAGMSAGPLTMTAERESEIRTALLDGGVPELLKELDATRAVLNWVRRQLWLGHGHYALYGDDGEMQCGICILDFKRDPIEELVAKVLDLSSASRTKLEWTQQVNAKLTEALVQIRVHLACELQPGAPHTGFPLAIATEALAEAAQ